MDKNWFSCKYITCIFKTGKINNLVLHSVWSLHGRVSPNMVNYNNFLNFAAVIKIPYQPIMQKQCCRSKQSKWYELQFMFGGQLQASVDSHLHSTRLGRQHAYAKQNYFSTLHPPRGDSTPLLTDAQMTTQAPAPPHLPPLIIRFNGRQIKRDLRVLQLFIYFMWTSVWWKTWLSNKTIQY